MGLDKSRWNSLTETERDAAYDNNAAVADSPALIAERNAASAAFRSKYSGSLDIPYGPLERNRWDLFRGEDEAAPCLVFIHGGYWQRNSRTDFSIFAEGALARGWSAALPGYSLAPDATFSEIVTEIGRALDWLVTEGGSWGIRGPIVLTGWSAGGHLAAYHLDHPGVAAGLAVSGIFDLTPLRDTSLNIKLSLTDTEINLYSPLRRPVAQKPLAIAYGENELPALVSDALQFHALRAASDAPGPLISIPAANHFTILREFRDPDSPLLTACANLIRG